MNYIVVDLEWNQSPTGKGGTVKEMPFEIIEIGAIKLNECGEPIGEFHEYINPKIYKTLHHKTQELLQLDSQVLEKAESFEQVIKRFFSWCGKDYLFCTWGVMDLTELQINLKYYGLEYLLVGPIRYYDIQKMFSIMYETKRIPHTLEYAVDYLKLEKQQSFHSAIHDAAYTANIVRLLDENTKRNYSIDCFNNPKTKNDEIYVIYDHYSKFISREFESKEDAIEDKDIKTTVCYKCGKRAAKKIKWFTSNSKNYYCLAYCREHGYLKGKVRMKRTDDNKVYAIKVLKLVEKEEANTIYKKQADIYEKKKIKRRQKSQEMKNNIKKENQLL